jgi:hypothetical protein
LFIPRESGPGLAAENNLIIQLCPRHFLLAVVLD